MQRDQTLTQSLITSQEENDPSQAQLTKARNKILSKDRQIGGASCWQTIFFTWVQPLLTFGAKNKVEVDLMPKLSEEYTTAAEFNKFDNIWRNIEKSNSEGWTLIRALFRLHLKEWIFLLISIIFTVTLFMSFPVLTALNVDYLQNYRDNVTRGILLFLLTFAVSVAHRIIFSQYFYRFMNLGIRLSSVVTMIIYNKALKYSPTSDKKFTEAEIINYCEVDSQRLVYVGDQIASFMYGPIQIVIGLIMMYFVIGIAFLSAIGIMIVILIISYFISKVAVTLNEKSLKAKDERMKATEEMLDIIRYIKISAIEKFFYKKVDTKRDKEIKLSISKGMNFVGLASMFWLITPMILTLSYMTYVFMGNDITSEVAFTVMSVVNLFEYPMYSLPNAVSQLIQIMTSIKRIEKFLFAQQIKIQNITYKNGASDNAIQITSGNYYWKRQEKKQQQNKNKDEKQKDKKEEATKKQEEGKRLVNEVNSSSIESAQSIIEDSDGQEEDLQPFREKDKQGKRLFIHALRDINTKIKKGSFTMIVGDIGSGKSSLLLAILNEMIYSQRSNIIVDGTISYSPQKPWIMSKTLKQNIIFAAPFSQQKFDKVIHFASLQADLKMLPKGVDTQIGQKGINISGGQKARVSLARSLYADRSILLLDDILSAVDVHVGEFIVRETIRDYLNGKTVVMPTHAIKFASFADQIIVMKKGKIVRKGPYEAICNTEEYQEITEKQHKHQEQEAKDQHDDQEKLEAEMTLIKEALRIKSKTSSQQKVVEVKNNQIVQQLMIPQDQEEGSLNVQVLKQFIDLNGGIFKFVVFIVVCLLLFIGVKTFASILIQLWCEEPSQKKYEIYIYIGLNIASIIFLFLTCYTIVISGARQSQKVHKQMIKRLLYASLGNFYNRVPTGRIVNRLTKDLRELDESIMYSFLFFLINMAELLGNLAICAYSTSPLVVVVMIVVGYLANLLRKYYLRTQMEVSRFQKTTNSPVVSGILSTISGLATIRAYGKSQQFTDWQFDYFDINKRVRLTKSGLENWFANTLAFLCFFINMPCIAYCMFSADSSSSVIGLLMTYAMYLVFSVAGLILCQADFQTKLVSIERIYKFMEIEPESRYAEYCNNWDPIQEEQQEGTIKNGELEFDKVKVRYRNDLPDVIKGITCKINKGEKIGIVGRTGAGKTTIINTLLGVTEISAGRILIDGQSIEELPLKGLRQSVTMIDQDPTLIKATFRENLDLTNKYTDSELEEILRDCNLWEIIEQKGGIQAAVSNNSLSAGQKQLLCICRAFLKHSKIVLIDEATANIDMRNDTIIQKVIAQKFKESTVLTIAHRLSTLQNSDKIMVMQQGMLVQFGSPVELQNKSGGVYAEMMKKHQKEMLK